MNIARESEADEPKRGGGGPNTLEGKERSSANALKAGCTAEKHLDKVIGDEAWEAVRGEYVGELKPIGPLQSVLVEGMARAAVKLKLTWDVQRAVIKTLARSADEFGITSAQGLDAALAKIASSSDLARTEVYHSRARNAFKENYRALVELRASQPREVQAEVVDHALPAGPPAAAAEGTDGAPVAHDAPAPLDELARAIDTRGCADVLWDVRAAAFGEAGSERPEDWRERLEERLKETYIGHTKVDRRKALLVGGAITANRGVPVADIRRISGIRRKQTVQRLRERIRTGDAQRDWVLAGLEVLLRED